MSDLFTSKKIQCLTCGKYKSKKYMLDTEVCIKCNNGA